METQPVVVRAYCHGARLLDGDARSGVGRARAANIGEGGGKKLFGGEVHFPPDRNLGDAVLHHVPAQDCFRRVCPINERDGV